MSITKEAALRRRSAAIGVSSPALILSSRPSPTWSECIRHSGVSVIEERDCGKSLGWTESDDAEAPAPSSSPTLPTSHPPQRRAPNAEWSYTWA